MGFELTKNDIIMHYLNLVTFCLAFISLTQKIDEFRNPLLKIDGFQGTHGTNTKGATAYDVL